MPPCGFSTSPMSVNTVSESARTPESADLVAVGSHRARRSARVAFYGLYRPLIGDVFFAFRSVPMWLTVSILFPDPRSRPPHATHAKKHTHGPIVYTERR